MKDRNIFVSLVILQIMLCKWLKTMINILTEALCVLNYAWIIHLKGEFLLNIKAAEYWALYLSHIKWQMCLCIHNKHQRVQFAHCFMLPQASLKDGKDRGVCEMLKTIIARGLVGSGILQIISSFAYFGTAAEFDCGCGTSHKELPEVAGRKIENWEWASWPHPRKGDAPQQSNLNREVQGLQALTQDLCLEN